MTKTYPIVQLGVLRMIKILNMKKLIILLALIMSLCSRGQDEFSGGRKRVWETLTHLPIDTSDWRYKDLGQNYLSYWMVGTWLTPIMWVDTIRGYKTPSIYGITNSLIPVIQLDSSEFTFIDDRQHCLEHELYHAAFFGALAVPRWMSYLAEQASFLGADSSAPYERIVRAAVTRRDIIDYFGLPLNALITESQFWEYVECKGELDIGLKWLLKTSKLSKMMWLINFENGWLINE